MKDAYIDELGNAGLGLGHRKLLVASGHLNNLVGSWKKRRKNRDHCPGEKSPRKATWSMRLRASLELIVLWSDCSISEASSLR